MKTFNSKPGVVIPASLASLERAVVANTLASRNGAQASSIVSAAIIRLASEISRASNDRRGGSKDCCGTEAEWVTVKLQTSRPEIPGKHFQAVTYDDAKGWERSSLTQSKKTHSVLMR